MIKPHDLAKYLRRGLQRPAEPREVTDDFRHFVVIPVLDELEELPNTLASLAVALPKAAEKTGVLLVVNHAPGASPERRAANWETLKRLRESDPSLLGGMTAGGNLFWIDAASPGREISRGVGEARRIGLDSALAHLACVDAGLLYSLDADSPVAPDYFVKVPAFFAAHPEYGALSLAVRHRPGKTAAEEEAIRRYEVYMADYVEKLRRAGSPYAFHTIGSAIVVRADAYIRCGGMRVRPGAEDFYFLQALRKVTLVGEFPEPLVYPAARPSDRVPFGTGPAIRSQLAGEALPTYPEAGFAELAALLAAATDEALRRPETFFAALSPYARNFLEAGGFPAMWPELLANTPRRTGAAREAFDRWFDALKTLQFIRNAK